MQRIICSKTMKKVIMTLIDARLLCWHVNTTHTLTYTLCSFRIEMSFSIVLPLLRKVDRNSEGVVTTLLRRHCSTGTSACSIARLKHKAYPSLALLTLHATHHHHHTHHTHHLVMSRATLPTLKTQQWRITEIEM